MGKKVWGVESKLYVKVQYSLHSNEELKFLEAPSHFGPVAQILISQPHSCENVLSAHPHNNSTYEPGWQPWATFWCHESLPLELSCSYACARVMIPTYPRLTKTHWGMCNSHIHGPPSPCPCGSLGAQAKDADDLRIWTSRHRLEVLSFWLQRRFNLGMKRKYTLPFLFLVIWNVLQDVLRARTKLGLLWALLSSLSAMVSISKIRGNGKESSLRPTVIHKWVSPLKVFCTKAAENFWDQLWS